MSLHSPGVQQQHTANAAGKDAPAAHAVNQQSRRQAGGRQKSQAATVTTAAGGQHAGGGHGHRATPSALPAQPAPRTHAHLAQHLSAGSAGGGGGVPQTQAAIHVPRDDGIKRRVLHLRRGIHREVHAEVSKLAAAGHASQAATRHSTAQHSTHSGLAAQRQRKLCRGGGGGGGGPVCTPGRRAGEACTPAWPTGGAPPSCSW